VEVICHVHTASVKNLLKICFVSLLFMMILVFTGCTGQKREPHGLTIVNGVLTVGVEIGYPPMEYYDTDGVTLTGFDIKLAKALADKLGFQVSYIDTAWEGILAGLETNKYDIAVNVTILPERQKKHNFTKPYIDSSMAIVLLKNSPLKIDNPENIAGCRVSYQSDTTAQYFSEKLIEKGVQFASFPYDKIMNCFDDLKLRRVDLVVVDNIVAFDYAVKHDSPFEVAWCGPSDELIGICLKKGNDALTAALDSALDELFAEGVMLKISREIFGRDMVSSVRN
jgi:polar amino acid transport system substrate-binding protein